MNPGIRKFFTLCAVFAGIFLIVRYLLPLFLPFLMGTALALTAEPLVGFLNKKIRLPRTIASGIGIAMSFSFLALAVMVLCAVVLQELRQLSVHLPELEDAARSGMASLSDWLLQFVQKAPEGIRSIATQHISDFFSSSSALLDKATGVLLSLASGILSRIPNSALNLGTAILSSFMISAKLPKLKNTLGSRIPKNYLQSLKHILTRLKQTIGGWFRAQIKLSGVNYLLICLGFLLLRIPYGPLWAFLVALVDAFPVLGTGTVLIPWSLVSFLQGQRIRAFGLLGIYAAAVISRTALEPRLVGHQLGLDPLATLIALYAGYRIWGLPGMLLAPMIASAVVQLTGSESPKTSGNG